MTDTTAPATKRENPFRLLLELAPLSEAEQRFLGHVQSGHFNPAVRPEVVRVCAILLGTPRPTPAPKPDRAPPDDTAMSA